jgi:hypothetical protein
MATDNFFFDLINFCFVLKQGFCVKAAKNKTKTSKDLSVKRLGLSNISRVKF